MVRRDGGRHGEKNEAEILELNAEKNIFKSFVKMFSNQNLHSYDRNS